MKSIALFVLLFVLALPAFAGGNKYPLTMTAVFTKGESVLLRDSSKIYHVGDYECTPGDEHNAPDCRTIEEWAKVDSMAGIPDTLLFTLADGSQVGVSALSIHEAPEYTQCSPGVEFIFCNLYYEFLGRQQVNTVRTSKYGQTESMSSEEYTAASEAKHRELFGDGNTMTLMFRYKLKGKPKDRFQRIELDKASCVTDGDVNECDMGIIPIMNSRGDGYFVGDTVQAPHWAK
jgi:hypothetical protein